MSVFLDAKLRKRENYFFSTCEKQNCVQEEFWEVECLSLEQANVYSSVHLTKPSDGVNCHSTRSFDFVTPLYGMKSPGIV
jgi:hypothetical protein